MRNSYRLALPLGALVALAACGEPRSVLTAVALPSAQLSRLPAPAPTGCARVTVTLKGQAVESVVVTPIVNGLCGGSLVITSPSPAHFDRSHDELTLPLAVTRTNSTAGVLASIAISARAGDLSVLFPVGLASNGHAGTYLSFTDGAASPGTFVWLYGDPVPALVTIRVKPGVLRFQATFAAGAPESNF